MATKRLTATEGKSIEVRAKVKRLGILQHLDGHDIEAEFPPDKLPLPGTTIYIHDRLLISGTDTAESTVSDTEIYFTVQQHIDSNRVRAAVAKVIRGSMADLRHAFAQGVRPVMGHAPTDITSVKALISHPMETSNGSHEPDQALEEHFIQEITCTHNERILLTGQWGRGIARDPYLAFDFIGGSKGDTVRLSWSDNQGNSDFAETTIK